MALNTGDRQFPDPQLDQALPVLPQGGDQIPQRGELFIECPLLEDVLRFTHGADWDQARINPLGYGELIGLGEALIREIVGRR